VCAIYLLSHGSLEFLLVLLPESPIDAIAGVAFREVRGKLFPSVGMKRPGEHVRVNFGQSPFVFDIDGMVSVSHNILICPITSLFPPWRICITGTVMLSGQLWNKKWMKLKLRSRERKRRSKSRLQQPGRLDF